MPSDSVRDQQAREQLAQDLRDSHRRAFVVGDQSATQEVLMALGALPDALMSGEFGVVGGLLGSTMGSMLDDGGSLPDIESAMLGNREVLYKLRISASRREQLEMFLDFGDQQMARLCQPGTGRIVIGALVRIFAKTITSIGMAQSEPPT